eukprot:491105-Hanusia_phi.AAC.3
MVATPTVEGLLEKIADPACSHWRQPLILSLYCYAHNAVFFPRTRDNPADPKSSVSLPIFHEVPHQATVGRRGSPL